MADSVRPFIVTYVHPTYPRRSVIVHALTQQLAETIASEQITGTNWTVSNVAPFNPKPH